MRRIHPSAKDRLAKESLTHASGPSAAATGPNTSSQTTSGPAKLQFGSQLAPAAKFSSEQQRRFESDLCKLFVANGYAWNSVNNPQTQIFYQNWTYTVKVHDISGLPKTAENHLRTVKNDIDHAEREYNIKIIAWVSDAGGDSRAMRVRLHRERPHILVFDCWAHQVNLIVGDVLKLNSELVKTGEQAIEIIRWMLHHSRLLALLHHEQLRLTGTTHAFNIPCITRWTAHFLSFTSLLSSQQPLQLLLVSKPEAFQDSAGINIPCITRWTAHFLSFTSLLSSQQPLQSLLVSKPEAFQDSAGRSPENLKEVEGIMKSIDDRQFWRNLNELKLYLEPLAIAANVAQAPTTRLDHILIELGHLYRIFRLYAPNPAVRQCVLDSLERRWGKCDQDPFILAVFLNPFIRARLFNPNNTSLNRSALYGIVKRVFRRIFRRDTGIDLYEAFIDYYACRNEFNPDKWDYEESKEIYERAGKPVNLMEVWSGLLAHKTPNSGRHQLTYLAIHVLSIVANSAGCERLFSEMGNIHTKRRNRLSFEKVFDTAVVKMNLKRQHAALGLTRARLQREFGISTTHPDGVALLPQGDRDAEKDQHDETAEEVAEIDMLDDDQTAYGMITLAARLHQDTIDDEDPEDEGEEPEEAPLVAIENESRPKRVRLFFGTQYPIRLQDLFDYNTSTAKGQGLDCFMQSGLANLQKELEIYDLATRDMFKSIMYADLQS
ncbi:hypothetical protein RSAG8_11497, partial [Rhizoctonia solani AG-8 WAC10335]